MRTAALAAAAGAVCLCRALALAVPVDDDLARRTFANADQLMREGKVEQAMREFEQVSISYAESGVADDALYRMGQHYYPVEAADELGGASQAALAKAKDLFARIASKYPREETAPRALLKLGLIALDPVNPQRNLDEAYASFSGVLNIYPSSDVFDRALFGAGYADFLAGRYDKSIASFERVAEEHAGRPIAQDAHYYMGLAYVRQGSWIRALEELQAVRNLFPDGKLAGRALDLSTRVYKMKVLPGISSSPLFGHDPSFAPAINPETIRGEISLAVDADSVVHVLSPSEGTVQRMGSDGKLVSTGAPLPGAVSIAVDAQGVEVVAAGEAIRYGVKSVGPQRREDDSVTPLEEITAAAGLGLGRIAFVDGAANEVLLFSGDPANLKVLYRDPEGRARLSGLAVGAEERLYTIDRKGRRIIEINPDGRSRQIGGAPGGEPLFAEPAAVSADDLGDLFVLDRRTHSVTILTTEGKVLQTITSQPGTSSEFASPTTLSVGPRAEIYIHDEKRRTILRYR
jgi:TolA-binding protein